MTMARRMTTRMVAVAAKMTMARRMMTRTVSVAAKMTMARRTTTRMVVVAARTTVAGPIAAITNVKWHPVSLRQYRQAGLRVITRSHVAYQPSRLCNLGFFAPRISS